MEAGASDGAATVEAAAEALANASANAAEEEYSLDDLFIDFRPPEGY